MKHSFAAPAAAAVGLCALAASASAAIVEVGATSSPVLAPTCPPKLAPSQCTIILTRSTALETIRDGILYPSAVKTPGQIVAFTVGLSSMSGNTKSRRTYIHSLDVTYGGTAQVVLTVLRPVGPATQRRWQVKAQSPIIHVQPFLGQVVQFPLLTTLSVVPGDAAAITTPTWAPVLSILQPSARFAYRQSRSANCTVPPATSRAQLKVGQSTAYSCSYPGTRVEYSATEVTTPVAPKNYVHAPRRPAGH